MCFPPFLTIRFNIAKPSVHFHTTVFMGAEKPHPLINHQHEQSLAQSFASFARRNGFRRRSPHLWLCTRHGNGPGGTQRTPAQHAVERGTYSAACLSPHRPIPPCPIPNPRGNCAPFAPMLGLCCLGFLLCLFPPVSIPPGGLSAFFCYWWIHDGKGTFVFYYFPRIFFLFLPPHLPPASSSSATMVPGGGWSTGRAAADRSALLTL